MDAVPLWAQILALTVLICISAFFAMTETALMAANRHRLRHLAQSGNKGAASALWLLERTDRMLTVVLIASTLINALATALVTLIAVTMFGNQETVLVIAIVLVSLLLIIFAQILPKILGASHPERIAVAASRVLRPLLTLAKPMIWLVHLLVSGLLRLMRIRIGAGASEQPLSADELRAMVMEGGNVMPKKHRAILLNLFDLEKISVEDVMTPRAQIESLDLSAPVEEIRKQLTTCYHNKLPVHQGGINQVLGILHVRKAVALLSQQEALTADDFRRLLTLPYFIPQDTDVFTQMQYFQENHERLGLIVDEYGEVQGLVTLDDLMEEIVGEFTTSAPGGSRADNHGWDARGECLIEGSATLREINKRLGLHFPLDGPKTMNGLLLEWLQDIPEPHVALKLAGCVIEIVQVQNQAIKVVKLVQPGNK
ncbi:HlyC/CorC family transporter|uniref:HlyC/CorC family transporter n=1 Tax=Noviherbaspirillum sp. L7-7A TaxID=2850560 RepID=UPI001C2C8C83|nr:HlyC/CorC family transporter [Noviherbaspirillum sp. L7-7A]MBV0879961.1 HlyC/CorC family transporter [Noviherbaspirillum sp. L7-7A]